MIEYVVTFGLQSYWHGDEVHSSDGKFRMGKSCPESATLDLAEVTVMAKSLDEAWPEAEHAAKYYLDIACFENDSHAQLGERVSLRGSDGPCEFCQAEEVAIAGCPQLGTLQSTEAYGPVKEAVRCYHDGLATQSSVPDYAYLSFFKAIEVLSGEPDGPIGDHIYNVLDDWKLVSEQGFSRIWERRCVVAHGNAERGVRRQTPSPTEITEVRKLARQCIEANLDT